MWPMKLDMTREECRGVLRRLELESYGTIISTFRAQGFLCKEKMRLLEDLRRILHISNDRHRAEARRVANDERLNTVAEIIYGPNSSQDWRREGHRPFPILPRSVPHTALTYIANTVYEQLTRANCKLPQPAKTSCDRLQKAGEVFKFELVRRELALFEKGFERDAAVVTSDPLQDIMSQSYIHKPVDRTEEPKSEEAKHDVPTTRTDDENKTDISEQTMSPPANEQPSLSAILLDAYNSTAKSSNTLNKCVAKSNKPGERSRKKSHGTKRQNKVRSPYPAGKPSRHGPAYNAKQSNKSTSTPSPHLMHSYAVPFDVVSVTNGGHSFQEPPQLQQHLTSNMPYPAQHGHNAISHQGKGHFSPSSFLAPKGTPSSPIHTASNYGQQASHLHSYKQQQGILPSSKKDIQYNLSKLNPTNSVTMKGNVNIPLRGSSNHPVAKSLPHLLMNYQKKANSKNILIPTSAAAATLASLGLPLADHTSEWISSKNGETSNKSSRMHAPQDVPNPRLSFSSPTTTSSSPDEVRERPTALSSSATAQQHISTNAPAQSSDPKSLMKTNVAFNKPSATQVVNNVLPLKQPNIAGFTPVKSGSKLSVSKTQLMPLGPPVSATQVSGAPTGIQKNNVFILPKSNTQNMLNLGQKVSIPKCIVDSSVVPSVTRSPPKVIVQAVPDLNNVVTFDINQEHKATNSVRQLVATEKPGSEFTHASTSVEVAAGTVRSIGNSQPALRPVSVEGVPSSAQTGDNIPVRKITVSTSQLVPFKGTLHGTTLPAANSCSTIAGSGAITNPATSNVAVSTTNPSTTISASAAITDWEQEVDRVNSTQNPTEELATLLPSPKTELVGKDVMKTGASSESENQRNLNPSNTLFRAISSSSSVCNEIEIVQGKYNSTPADRGDDSSATDSADAEEDPEDEPTRIGEDDGIEEDDYGDEHTVDVETDNDAIIIEEDDANYDSLIEEVAEDENYIEEIVDEQMEIGYDSSRGFVTEMEGTSEHIIVEHANSNGIENQPPRIHFEQCSDVIAEETIENGSIHQQSPHSAKDDIVCELLEIDADGTYSTRQFSYEQAIAEGLTVLPTMAKPSKTKRSVS